MDKQINSEEVMVTVPELWSIRSHSDTQPSTFVCWNVNGLSQRFRKLDGMHNFKSFVTSPNVNSDIIALSEVHVKNMMLIGSLQ